jgi:hypothetical protein
VYSYVQQLRWSLYVQRLGVAGYVQKFGTPIYNKRAGRRSCPREGLPTDTSLSRTSTAQRPTTGAYRAFLAIRSLEQMTIGSKTPSL